MLRNVYRLLPTFRDNQSFNLSNHSSDGCYVTYIGYYRRLGPPNRSHPLSQNTEGCYAAYIDYRRFEATNRSHLSNQSTEGCYATYICNDRRFGTTNRSHISNHNSENITQRILVITDVSVQQIAPIFQSRALRDITQRILLLPTFRNNLSVPSSGSSLEDVNDSFVPWTWDRYVVPKRRQKERRPSLHRCASLKSQWAKSIQSRSSHPISWYSITILSSHLCLCLSNCLLSSGSIIKTL